MLEIFSELYKQVVIAAIIAISQVLQLALLDAILFIVS